MAIGTPQDLGTTAPTPTSLTRILTITHNVNVGQFIGVFMLLGSSRTPLFSDSGGNSYTSTSIALPGLAVLWFGYSANPTTGMTSGVGTITADWSASAAPDDPTMSAFQVSGVDLTTPISVTGSVASGTGMTISPALTITPAAANELAVAVTAVNGTAGAYVTDAGHGWTLLNKVQEAAGGQLQAVDYQSASALVTNTPTWAISLLYGGMAWTLKPAAAGGATVPRLLTLGVG